MLAVCKQYFHFFLGVFCGVVAGVIAGADSVFGDVSSCENVSHLEMVFGLKILFSDVLQAVSALPLKFSFVVAFAAVSLVVASVCGLGFGCFADVAQEMAVVEPLPELGVHFLRKLTCPVDSRCMVSWCLACRA